MGCRFDVAMGKKGYQEFIAALDSENAGDVMNRMLASIDVSKSQAYKDADRKMILDAVSKSVGLIKLNGIVLGLMRDWALDSCEKEVNIRMRINPENPSTLSSIDNLAALYYKQGKYDKAEPLYVECLEKRKAVLGDTHPDTLSSINNLAALYKNHGK